jgi:hypothetical protein
MKWLSNYLNKIRFGKNIRSDIYVDQIVRDSKGKWVTDDEQKLVYKSDDPKRIEKFTLIQEKKSEASLLKCCGGKGKCNCSPDPVSKKPTAKKATPKVEDKPKPVAKKPTATKKPAPKKK